MSDWQMKGKPALLILHMQKGMLGKDSHFQGLAEMVHKSGAISHQQTLLQAFRSKHLPVIFVNVQNNPPLRGNWPAYGFVWNQLSSAEVKIRDMAEVNPRDIEVISELAPQNGEPVLINWPISAFNNSGLDQALKACGAETLVLAGFATNGVVLSTLIMAADRYYSVIVPSDASTSPSVKAHEAIINIIALDMALVTTTEDIIAHL
jgi:nicotinamidase-related amidase